MECVYTEYKTKYPYSAIATRDDGYVMTGCYGPQDADLIEIQWYKGDVSVIPANAFLLHHEAPGQPQQAEAPKIDI